VRQSRGIALMSVALPQYIITDSWYFSISM